jgi:hypothetical protein
MQFIKSVFIAVVTLATFATANPMVKRDQCQLYEAGTVSSII